ncbi:hypothetical protein FZC37_01455 [Candidatus Sneabacter namystus]|uniref:Uncharacterized protein n=1 Tax=Candidatus Sneabacter namystus TaxID=2601646 RepID=A0A5C0UIM0_9RICK|nr:hypothetical protein FZC37_01455 [Candidatus Sneabacter namystus]
MSVFVERLYVLIKIFAPDPKNECAVYKTGTSKICRIEQYITLTVSIDDTLAPSIAYRTAFWMFFLSDIFEKHIIPSGFANDPNRYSRYPFAIAELQVCSGKHNGLIIGMEKLYTKEE